MSICFRYLQVASSTRSEYGGLWRHEESWLDARIICFMDFGYRITNYIPNLKIWNERGFFIPFTNGRLHLIDLPFVMGALVVELFTEPEVSRGKSGRMILAADSCARSSCREFFFYSAIYSHAAYLDQDDSHGLRRPISTAAYGQRFVGWLPARYPLRIRRVRRLTPHATMCDSKST